MDPSSNIDNDSSGSRTRMKLKLDCRHYLGDRPCRKGCQGECQYYEPMGHRILLIKLAALGDVIGTEALLPGLKNAFPTSHITWVRRADGCCLLAGNPLIDRRLEYGAETLCRLQCEKLDLVINLDKEPGPAALALQVDAEDKRGIGLSPHGTICPLNAEAHYYFALGLSDHLKFEDNQSSYQRLIYEALGLPYDGERYSLFPSPADEDHAREVLRRAGVRENEELIGLNTGAGSMFANKTWPAEKFVTLTKNLLGRGDCRVMLLGGRSKSKETIGLLSRPRRE